MLRLKLHDRIVFSSGCDEIQALQARRRRATRFARSPAFTPPLSSTIEREHLQNPRKIVVGDVVGDVPRGLVAAFACSATADIAKNQA